jgi:TRAP-type mannitol/chloroaromatic compound transport system permease large subunit
VEQRDDRRRSVVLAFVAGFALTALPFLRRGYALADAARIALAADAASITVMEIVDNVVMLLITGAMDASPASLLFWGSLALSLVLAGIVAFPVQQVVIARDAGMRSCMPATPARIPRREASPRPFTVMVEPGANDSCARCVWPLKTYVTSQ